MVRVPNPSYCICGTYTLHLAMLSWLKLAQDDTDPVVVWAISLDFQLPFFPQHGHKN